MNTSFKYIKAMLLPILMSFNGTKRTRLKLSKKYSSKTTTRIYNSTNESRAVVLRRPWVAMCGLSFITSAESSELNRKVILKSQLDN